MSRSDEPLFGQPVERLSGTAESLDRLADLAATLADLSTTLRAAARAAGRASAALWGVNDPEDGTYDPATNPALSPLQGPDHE